MLSYLAKTVSIGTEGYAVMVFERRDVRPLHNVVVSHTYQLPVGVRLGAPEQKQLRGIGQVLFGQYDLVDQPLHHGSS